MKEIDIWRTAKALIDSHGDRAASEAAKRAERALVKADTTEIAVWKRIERAIKILQGET
jgi:hypothetical protein